MIKEKHWELYQALEDILTAKTEQSKEITLEYKKEQGEHISRKGKTFKIPYIDQAIEKELISILEAFTEETLNANELYQIEASKVTSEDFQNHPLVSVDAGDLINPTDKVRGNNFYSSADTYGPYYFSESYLYLPLEDAYIIVSKKYFAI